MELGSTMDIYTTSIKLAGGKLPDDRIVDGVDLSPVLFGKGPSPRKTMFYYRGTRLMAVRKGPFKAHFITQAAYGGGGPKTHETPELYHLDHDPSEQFNIATQHPDVIADIRREVEKHQAELKAAPSQLEIPLKK